MDNLKLTFSQFLDFFPIVDLPVLLSDESLIVFSKENLILPIPFIEQFISKYDLSEIDEFTEYIPCFRIPETENFHGIVYWKAQLMNYEYHLLTFDQHGNFITGKVIGGMISNGTSLIKTVATIDEDWVIHIVAGENSAGNSNYVPSNSKAYSMELLATGDIIFSLTEKDIEF